MHSKQFDTKILITIDTEVRIAAREWPDAFDRHILGHAEGKEYGAYWISDQLNQYGFKGVFFLDVCGTELFQEAPYRDLCLGLIARGQDVQLHTHPDQMYDIERKHMHEYSLEDQTKIIRNGMECMKSWTGTYPIAHRAGRYGANDDTLKALYANGIFIDSSFFHHRSDCKLTFPYSNAPMKKNGVLEIPVTAVAEPIQKRGYRFPRWTRHLWRRYQKLDVLCMSAENLCFSVKELYGQVPYIITFMHSFSFIEDTPSEPIVNHEAVSILQALLRMLSKEKMPVITFDEIAEDFDFLPSNVG